MENARLSLRNKPSLPSQIGFSLVEILVGLVIGLLATLVIMQVFSVFEGQKRSTTSSSDAQTNGGIALYSLVRDVQMAGYGLLPVEESAIECDVPNVLTTAADAGVPTTSPPLSPVIITDGGTAAGASDSIAIRYGTSSTAGNPKPITLMTGAEANIGNNLGCQIGVAVVLTGPTTCNLTTVTGLPASSVTLGDAGGAVAGNSIACLGSWNEITYAANAGNLERDASPSITGIVNIQAQYGISSAVNNNQVEQWVDARGIWAATNTTPTTANRNRIKAVRIAVVARNGLMEKTDVSQTCSSLTADAPTGVCAWSGTSTNPIVASPAPRIDLSNDANWRKYRYRVFETIIPLRNVVWSKGTL